MAAYHRVDGLVTCGLTAFTPESAPGQTLGNEYGRTLPLPFYCIIANSHRPTRRGGRVVSRLGRCELNP